MLQTDTGYHRPVWGTDTSRERRMTWYSALSQLWLIPEQKPPPHLHFNFELISELFFTAIKSVHMDASIKSLKEKKATKKATHFYTSFLSMFTFSYTTKQIKSLIFRRNYIKYCGLLSVLWIVLMSSWLTSVWKCSPSFCDEGSRCKRLQPRW